jgi:ATP-dependent DNA helicase RecG
LINCVDPLTASQHLRRLRDAGLLEQQGKGSATYYTLHSDLLDNDLSSEFTEQVASNLAGSPIDKGLSSEFTEQDSSNLAGNSSHIHQRQSYLQQMPEHLRDMVEQVGQRSTTEEVKAVIVELCSWRDLSSSELAAILRRNQVYLRTQYLNSLIKSSKLQYIRQENPSDPHQAYRATKLNKE